MAEGSSSGLRTGRRSAWLVLPLCLLALLLSACSGKVQPFSKATKVGGRTPPAIIVRSISGLPADREQFLFNSLAAAAGPRDIAIVRDDFQGGYSLSGEFRADQGPEGVVLTYRWTLIDDKGRPMHEIANSEPGRPVTGDPWQGIDPDTLRRVANYTAESLSSRLSQLGFATQSAGLLPPVDTYAEAGPGAENDIDPTLYGVLASAVMAPQPAAATVGPREFNQDVADVAVDPAEPDREEAIEPEASSESDSELGKADLRVASRVAGGKGDREDLAKELERPAQKLEINAVAVTKVRGARGKGNTELAVAMRRTLGEAGWPVLASTRPDALTVEGTVRIAEARGSQQTVELSWTVKMPDGLVLGTVRQANNVPAGSLDKAWGEAAQHATQGAAEGIFNLVAKARKNP